MAIKKICSHGNSLFSSPHPLDFDMWYIFLLSSTFIFQKTRKNCTTSRPPQIWRTLVRRLSTQELRS